MNKLRFGNSPGFYYDMVTELIGGGGATVAVVQTELIDRTKESGVDTETFTLSFDLACLTPETNLLSFGTGIGCLSRGLSVAIPTLLAGSVPCSVIVFNLQEVPCSVIVFNLQEDDRSVYPR